MASITSVAEAFFADCETGKGWEVCRAYCAPDATFRAQAEPLLDVKTLAQYTDWMKGMLTVLPDGRYEIKSFATDVARSNVSAYGVFHGTHSGPGGPVPPTGRQTSTDYVYVMQFEGDKIVHMTKIWHAGIAMKERAGPRGLVDEGRMGAPGSNPGDSRHPDGVRWGDDDSDRRGRRSHGLRLPHVRVPRSGMAALRSDGSRWTAADDLFRVGLIVVLLYLQDRTRRRVFRPMTGRRR